MHDAITLSSHSENDRERSAAHSMAEWYGGVEGMLARLVQEAEGDDLPGGVFFLIDRTSTSVLEDATGKPRHVWFGLLRAPEERYGYVAP